MRTVKICVSIMLTIKIDEGTEVDEIMDEMEYDFSDTTTKATIENSEIIDFEVIDSY